MADDYLSGGTIAPGTTYTAGSGTDGNIYFYVSGAIDNQGTIEAVASDYYSSSYNAYAAQSTQVFIQNGAILSGGGAFNLVQTGKPQGQVNLTSYVASSSSPAPVVTFENIDNSISGSGTVYGVGTNSYLAIKNDAAGVIDANDPNNRLEFYFYEDPNSNQILNNGVIESTAAGGLQALYTRFDQTGGGKLLASGNGHIDLETVTISGGSIQTTGQGVVNIANLDSSGALTVTFDGTSKPLSILAGSNVDVQAVLQIEGAIANSGVITAEAGSQLTVAASATLSGGGSIVLRPGGSRAQFYNASGQTDALENVDNTISGAGLLALLSFTNDSAGSINGNDVAQALVLENMGTAGTATMVNKGTIESTGAGGLQAYYDIINQTGGGRIIASGSGHVDLTADTISGGSIQTSGQGVVNIDNLTGGGSFTVTFDGTAQALTITTGSQVDVQTDLALTGSVVNSGVITVEAGSQLLSASAATLSGGGSIVMRPGASRAQFYNESGQPATFENVDNTISGAGLISTLSFTNDAGGTINGTDASQALVLENLGSANTAAMVNKGLLESTGSGGLQAVYDNIDQTGGGRLLASGVGHIDLDTDTISGGTLQTAGQGVINIANLTGGGSLLTTFDGSSQALTIASGSNVDVQTNLALTGAIANSGVITVEAGSQLEVPSGATLSGGGFVVMHAGASQAQLNLGSGQSATVENVDNAIAGAGLIAGVSLVNDAKGLVDANVSGATLLLNARGAITNNGLLAADAGALQVDDAVAGSGSALVKNGGSLVFNNSFNENVQFQGAGALGLSHSYSGVISGFAPGDTIDLSAFYNQPGGHADMNTQTNVLTVTEGASTYTLQFDPSQNFNGFYFHASADNGGSGSGTLITEDTTPPCYLRGTRISTERGEVAVEDLVIGERVVTSTGALRPIVWIGYRELDVRKHRWPLDIMPVRVRRGAFGEGAPRRDLWLSPSHAVSVNGVLVPVIALANGATVLQEPAEKVSYWHVELESHDILLAEGLPAESFLDCDTRRGFANYAGFVELHPTFRPKHRAESCAPVIEDGRVLRAIRARLGARARKLGFSRSLDPDLRLLVQGRTVRPARTADGAFQFALPCAAPLLTLLSRTCRPADDGVSGDRRHLGVAVCALEIDGAVVDLAKLGAGWREQERDGHRSWRWSDGKAVLPSAKREVVIRLASNGAGYWIEAATRMFFPEERRRA